MTDEYFDITKKLNELFNAFEEDKKNKAIKGIKEIVGNIENIINDLFSKTKEFNKYFKVEFTNTLYKCFGTQRKIDNLNNQVSQLYENINKLHNLIEEKGLITKVNKLNSIKDDYEFFKKKLNLFLPKENPSNKIVNFSEINEKSDLLKLPIISIVNNNVTCSYPNLKLNFGPYISSLYSEPIMINFTSLIKNLSMGIKNIEPKYKQLLRCFVDNSNGIAQLKINIPKMTNNEKENEIVNIKCKIEFNSPNCGSCILDCEFNIEIIPLNIIVYCDEYNLAKNNDNNYILCVTEILYGNSINLHFKHYNIDKQLNFTYKIESLEKNTSEKPEIKKLKDGLQLIMGNKDEKSIKRLVCQLTINFNNSFMISINNDCFLFAFDFKFEVY